MKYDRISHDEVQALDFVEAKKLYRHALTVRDVDMLRWMCRHDRFFLTTCVMGRVDAMHPWLYARCREAEADSHNILDTWSRFHYKSTFKTVGGAVQEILIDPNITIGVLANVFSLSKKFVAQIQRELEKPNLYALFPDILYKKPPKRNWSVQEGLIVKRSSNSKEPTVQAAGLVDGQPIGAHYALRIYDDIVTPESVNTPEQIEKTTQAWELSLALGTHEGGRAWYSGTRYHPNDTYQVLLDRKALKERRRICYDKDGKSVLMPDDKLQELRREMGERTFSAQMLQDPVGDGVRMFRPEWFQTLETMPSRSAMNVYIFIDSANAKKKTNDFTTMMVIGLGRDRNFYILDGIHDRLNLAERTRALFELVERWSPLCTFWEQVGMASDVQHVQLEQDRIGWHFPIKAIGQSVAKIDRIGWLVPYFEAGRIWFQARILRQSVAGETYDFVVDFLNKEYSTYPICSHDDMLDTLANISHPACVASIRFPVSPRQEGAGTRRRTTSKWKPLG